MSPALALCVEYPNAGVTRQRHVPDQSRSDFPKSLHSVSSLPVPQLWTGDEEMYLAPRQKFYARDEHLKRISEALKRRLYPFTPLHQKVLAGAVGVTRNTVNNWCNAKCDPGSHEMGLLHDFFKSTEGSALFWVEIYGDLAEPRAKRYAEAK